MRAEGVIAKGAHAFAQWLLQAIRAHDVNSWNAGKSSGYVAGHEVGRIVGHDEGLEVGRGHGHEEGRKEGLQEGYQSGHVAGFDAGKLVLDLNPGSTQTDVAPGVDINLFEHFDFPISEELEQRIRSDIKKNLPSYQQPTDPQWEMILSRSPSTYIVAGAGSGKSTTMVLRLLVLRYYLNVSVDYITVVTFTRDSRFDFIAKVIKIFKLWDLPMDEKKGKSFVRTFHSRILDFFKWSPAFQGAKAFEFLSKDATGEDEEPENVLDIRLNSRQLDLMNRCYQNLFENHERFRELIIELVKHSVSIGEPLNPKDPEQANRIKMLKKCSARDQEACQAVESLWRKAGLWPMPGVSTELEAITLNGHIFHAHGYAEDLNALVVLGLDQSEPDTIKIKDGDKETKLSLALNMRRIFLQLFCSKRVLYFTNYEEALSSLETMRGRVSAVPKFSYQVGGDIKPAPIMQAFHSAASFLENLGLEVPEAVKAMSFLKKDMEAKFFEALGLFWPAFESFLAEQSPRIFTFNKMFAMYSEQGEENFSKLPDSVLKSQMVTLVDEFQDCGANTISWLRGVFTELRLRGLQYQSSQGSIFPSLMAVGDDWQSIYGWRGSSPKFFQQFEQYFPSPKTLPLMLQQNFRSQQMVIDAAESIVKHTRSIENKHGEAAHPDVKDLSFPVQLWQRDDQRLVDLVDQHYEAGHEIMVLSRSRSTLAEVTNKLAGTLQRARREKHADRIRIMTYHGSKGLEADVVFLVGDCEQLSSSNWRNQAYAMAKLVMNGEARAYDFAQGEEVMRLAYVAITRAKIHCYWFLDAPKTGSLGYPKASDRIDKQQPYFRDLRR
ncbi:UvrD-helicase domain-containing protein [Pseudomonas sp. JL3]|uniref:UvrD-helicase domain-containing protein n=1 Tax=Pseudomonas sp. JL3 TaxID=2919943 RepID=UPI002863CC84|nr:UvrD-helicase domain-containing protein [Pseudomonas sp. JL3]MDR8364110.1 UvrD-helicase domain-containing protein [Pseudomonas sp. JL3]